MGAGHDKLLRDLVMVQDDGCRRVGFLPDAHVDFLAIEERQRKKLERHFRNYGVPGTSMTREHFNSEGRHSIGDVRGKSVHVCVFKAFQDRVYGVVTDVHGVETFVGVKVARKKTDRADQALLARVARSFAPYVD